MNANEHFNDELKTFEHELASLSPAEGPALQDAMYQAGLAAGRRTRRWWQGVAAAAAMLAVATLAVSLLHPRTRVVEVERIVHVPAPGPRVAPARPTAAISWDAPTDRPQVTANSYIVIRQAVLERGLSELPRSSGGGRPTQRPEELLQELLDNNG